MKTRWYKDAVIYQIYPRSFKDSNGDGIGDINGIISKLDYLKDLGVNAVWLSPCYKSPNFDNGYDISDYKEISPEFGTLEEFKTMLKGMKERGIKLIMDLVVNHTSIEHEWFKQSRSSKDNPYRDYYIWRRGRGKNGKRPPNNWSSRFVGKAWSYDETTKEWYLHLFSKEQPDLNWENVKVREAVADICNYWLSMGVDGFRCDVITYISKEQSFKDGKWNIALRGDEHFVIGPRYHEFVHELYQKSWGKFDTMTVGEAIGTRFSDAISLIDEKHEELDTIFNFEHMETDMYWQFFPHRFSLPKFKSIMSKWQALPETSWNSLYLENHDQPRSLLRFTGDYGALHREAATMLAVMLQLQKGTPYIYQGQEIGMTNCTFKREEYLDIMAKRVFGIFGKIPFLLPLASYAMSRRARDHARTPMQWSAVKNAGFTTGTPWMKINENYKQINVQDNLENSDSILAFYKKLIKYRLGNPLIIKGECTEHYPKNKDIYVYERSLGEEKLLVICNFKNKQVPFTIPESFAGKTPSLELSNYADASPRLLDTLRPYEALVYKFK